MAFQFDENGFLKPGGIVNTELATVERVFVDDFPLSDTHRRLFNNFLRYLGDFQSRVSREFVLWMNGSFVTRKNNPNDLDFVVFLNHQVYDAQETFLDKFWTFSLEPQGLDAYIVKTFPENHLMHYQTISDMTRWNELYSTAKSARNPDKYTKGFAAIDFR